MPLIVVIPDSRAIVRSAGLDETINSLSTEVQGSHRERFESFTRVSTTSAMLMLCSGTMPPLRIKPT